MTWVRAVFRGQKVWAECNPDGSPRVDGGRRAIRYSEAAGATIYRAGAAALRDEPGSARELPDGTAAAPREPGAAGDGTRARPTRGSGFGSAGTRSSVQAAAAAADARARIDGTGPDTILAFTDGACTGNPGPAGSGVVVRHPDGRTEERHRALGVATNNIGELTAIAMALELLDAADVPPRAPVALFTDSTYAIGVLQKGWKAKANPELIAGIREALRRRPGVVLHWVAGHVGVAENERADALARRGVEESRARR
ncbi:MAG: hypothetical protein RLZZ299_1312 [Pseudomonadota bacterium]|jgi:ribonuclease HI